MSNEEKSGNPDNQLLNKYVELKLQHQLLQLVYERSMRYITSKLIHINSSSTDVENDINLLIREINPIGENQND